MNDTTDGHGPHGRFFISYGPTLASYTFCDDHPLQPSRHQLTLSLLSSLGWLDRPDVDIKAPRAALLEDLLAIHTYPYIQAVGHAQAIAQGTRESMDLSFYGLGTEDNPLFDAMHDAPTLCAGATLEAMKAILEGRAIHAYSPAGGLHHAMRARASGFCVYNDCSVAIAAAVQTGNRIAYVDLDAHHGDGVQTTFYSDPRVLTISVHESGRFLFPGTGSVDEIGAGHGLGTCINVPLPATAGDDAILRAMEQIVEPALREFAPDLLVAQTGCDTHHSDPLTDLTATLSLYPQLAERLHKVAHECCNGRWLVVGGGGYDPADVTPRAWTAFVGTILGYDTTDVRLPDDWVQLSQSLGGDPPWSLLEDKGPGYEPLDSGEIPRLLREVQDTALAALRRHRSRF